MKLSLANHLTSPCLSSSIYEGEIRALTERDVMEIVIYIHGFKQYTHAAAAISIAMVFKSACDIETEFRLHLLSCFSCYKY